MRSKANVHGHPLHAALIPFPLAFIYGAFMFDVLGELTNRPSLWTTAGHLAVAGIVSAFIASVPGIVDYRKTVPPRSSAKSRATKHMIVNLAGIVAIAVAVGVRPDASLGPDLATLGLEAVAVALITAGSWMGGTLMIRNQIGIDHRYAHAGKWTEATVTATSDESVVVARADELEVGQMKLVHVNGSRVVLGRTEEAWVAFEDRCSHRGGSLADGALICGTVQCPWHGAQFDVRTGAVEAGPAEQAISAYEVEEVDGTVRLMIARRETAAASAS